MTVASRLPIWIEHVENSVRAATEPLADLEAALANETDPLEREARAAKLDAFRWRVETDRRVLARYKLALRKTRTP